MIYVTDVVVIRNWLIENVGEQRKDWDWNWIGRSRYPEEKTRIMFADAEHATWFSMRWL
jgi:hypothetical protein